MTSQYWPEIALVDKPTGISSFDVIRRLRRKYTNEYGVKAPKMGHAGTLDPRASGLMIVGVGSGTKKLAELTKLDKEYIAEILIGERRSTGDMEGEVLEEKDVEAGVVAEIFSAEKISATFENMCGTRTLPVSAYSAIKKDGVPMYKRARKAEKEGKLVEDVPMREMKVYEAELLDIAHISTDSAVFEKDKNSRTISAMYRTNCATESEEVLSQARDEKREPIFSSVNRTKNRLVVTVRFHVASGTYIRSLAEDFGKQFRYPATLKNLRRTKAGEFKIEDAISLS